MDNQTEQIVETAIRDPERIYKNPEEVLRDTRLTQEQKDRILHCWELDQLALLRAEEENMPPRIDDPSPIDVLEKIKEAEKALEHVIKEGKVM